MSEDAHDERTTAQAATADAHEGGRPCAWPDGCDNPVPQSNTGRPARYCHREVAGVVHNATNAGNRRRRARPEDGEPAGAASNSPTAGAGLRSVLETRGSLDEQVQALARLVGEFGQRLDRFSTDLSQVTDADAAARDIVAERRRGERALQEVQDERDEIAATLSTLRGEFTEEQAAREDADAATDEARRAEAVAREQAERAQADAEAAREGAETARAEARQQVADAEQRAADALAEADRRVQAVEQDSEQRVAEAHAQADETVRAARAEHARELESVRAEAEERARGAEVRAHEAEQQTGRAEQRAVDAEGLSQWLRDQLDQLRAQYREDVAAVRAEADQRIADLRAAYETRARRVETEAEEDDERPT